MHGDIAMQSRATPLEARDPITNYKPDTRYYNYKGYLQAPIVKGRVGFLGSAGYWQQDDNAFVHATVLAPSTLAPTPYSDRIATPIWVTSQSMQIDFKQGGDLVNASYARTRETDRNLGLQSGFDLAEHAYDRSANDGVARVWWTRVAGHLVNDARIEFTRGFSATTPLTTTSAILVLDAFNAGGNQYDWTERSTRSMQASDAVTLQRGRHTYKAGAQYEAIRQDIVDCSGFGRYLHLRQRRGSRWRRAAEAGRGRPADRDLAARTVSPYRAWLARLRAVPVLPCARRPRSRRRAAEYRLVRSRRLVAVAPDVALLRRAPRDAERRGGASQPRAACDGVVAARRSREERGQGRRRSLLPACRVEHRVRREAARRHQSPAVHDREPVVLHDAGERPRSGPAGTVDDLHPFGGSTEPAGAGVDS